ncbi:hypothetical protein CRE_01663 [Caenorhabditis remanei]|uniref:GH18 domain-containing protein n=1 Tax=Caenorhabditis remanei TaxID=31234 RepID=E3LH25_CAERE|nr:hypothetical protein CRE_01663 [Caenorhabditis remanei]
MSNYFDSQLLYKLSNYHDPAFYWTPKRVFKYALGTLSVLVVCGIIAFGLTSFIFLFIPDLDSVQGSVASTKFAANPPSCSKRIIGYYTEFESIDVTKNQLEKLTHAVFAYIEMRWDGKIQFKSEKTKNRFLGLKRKAESVKSDVKVMISIGGEENSQFFAPVTADSDKFKTFIESVSNFLDDHQIDGVDFYWKRAAETDKWHYISMLRELRRKLKDNKNGHKDYIISITLPAAGIENWEVAYDLDQTLEFVDFINVFSMDFYGPWPNQWGTPAGPTAPLYSGVGARKNFNIDWTMEYYVCKARQPSKFNIVVPFFVRLWKNVEGAVENGKEVYRNAELKDNKVEGNSYMSRQTAQREGFSLKNSTWDEPSKSSYIFDSNAKTYLSFETEKSIEAKKKYVIDMNLGGFWVWTVDMDDDKSSMLNSLTSNGFCSGKNDETLKYKC